MRRLLTALVVVVLLVAGCSGSRIPAPDPDPARQESLTQQYRERLDRALDSAREDAAQTQAQELPDPGTMTYRVGAQCADGTISGATGQGACSHHGGVARWARSDCPQATVRAHLDEAWLQAHCRLTWTAD
jgi:hypothetical protein